MWRVELMLLKLLMLLLMLLMLLVLLYTLHGLGVKVCSLEMRRKMLSR